MSNDLGKTTKKEQIILNELEKKLEDYNEGRNYNILATLIITGAGYLAGDLNSVLTGASYWQAHQIHWG